MAKKKSRRRKASRRRKSPAPARARVISPPEEVTYAGIKRVLSKGRAVRFKYCGEWCGGVVEGCEKYKNFFGEVAAVDVEFVRVVGSGFEKHSMSFRIPKFTGHVETRKLPVQPIDEGEQERLGKIGKRTIKMQRKGAAYLQYKGDIVYDEGFFGIRRTPAHGRVMIDGGAMTLVDPEYRYVDEEDLLESEAIDPWMVSPWVLGFSFFSGSWGELLVSNLKPILFEPEAYEQLVLPPRDLNGMEVDCKDLVRALVETRTDGFKDLLSYKGGGTVFLLHGPPGTGKTLTAEAVSELLKRPLYRVSTGELGTTAEDMENRLKQILMVAERWKAVVLIDEADVFLEKRQVQDIDRNAMVAVFLRLLEYYQGVLFLTTNRVETFDPAFHSRISLALHYPDLDHAARQEVWQVLLGKAGHGELRHNTAALADVPLNGRQIKNVIRVALAYSTSEGREMELDDLQQMIALVQLFNSTHKMPLAVVPAE